MKFITRTKAVISKSYRSITMVVDLETVNLIEIHAEIGRARNL